MRGPSPAACVTASAIESTPSAFQTSAIACFAIVGGLIADRDRQAGDQSRVSRFEGHENLRLVTVRAEQQRDVRRDVARAIVDHGMGLLEMRPMRMSLEDIFLQIMGDAKAGKGAL